MSHYEKEQQLPRGARKVSVYLHEIADALGKNEPTFSRWLRKETTEEMKNKALAAIEKLLNREKVMIVLI